MAFQNHTGEPLIAAFLLAYGGTLHVEDLTQWIHESRLGDITQNAQTENRIKSVTSYLSRSSWFDQADGKGSWSVVDCAIENEDVQWALRDVQRWIQQREDEELRKQSESVQIDFLWQQVRDLRSERRKLYNQFTDQFELHPSLFR